MSYLVGGMGVLLVMAAVICRAFHLRWGDAVQERDTANRTVGAAIEAMARQKADFNQTVENQAASIRVYQQEIESVHESLHKAQETIVDLENELDEKDAKIKELETQLEPYLVKEFTIPFPQVAPIAMPESSVLHVNPNVNSWLYMQ